MNPYNPCLVDSVDFVLLVRLRQSSLPSSVVFLDFHGEGPNENLQFRLSSQAGGMAQELKARVILPEVLSSTLATT